MTTEATPGADSHLSIGEVLEELRGDFPDVTISKIRFLESQGLIDPERTPSGYRRFYPPDLERLRWILLQQRDHFLPLRVIKERLDASGPGGAPRGEARGDFRSEPRIESRPEAHAESSNGGGVPPRREAPAPPIEQTPSRTPAPSSPPPFAPVPAPSTPAPPTPAPPTPAPPTPAPAPLAPARPTPPPPTAVPTLLRPPEHPSVPAPDARPAPSAPSPPKSPSSTPTPSTPQPPRPVAESPPPRPSSLPSRLPPPPSTALPFEEVGMLGEDEDAREEMGAIRPPDDRPTATGLTRAEILEATGITDAQLDALESFGILVPFRGEDGRPVYDDEALAVGEITAGYYKRGIEPRHLKMYWHFAQREAALMAQVLLPFVRQRNPTARTRLQEEVEELARLGRQLRTAMLRRALRDTLSE